MIKSLNKKFLPGVLVLIFLLTMAISEAALSQESPAGEQNVLRRASLEWMQIGMEQYQSKQFTQAEQSFRRALVFQKYLTDAERNRLNKFLANARIAISKEKQAGASPQTAEKLVQQPQPVKAAAKVEKPAADPRATEQKPQQVKKVPKTISDPPGTQQVQPVVMAQPGVPKIDIPAEIPGDIVVVKKRSTGGNLQTLSAWLTENRREILMIGLPLLAVLVIITKLQGRKKRPGRRVYENPALASSSSFIGARLNEGNGNGNSKNGRPASAAANPAFKPFETNELWPGRKDKFEEGDSVSARAGRKQCGKCKELKPLSDFYKNKSTKDGLARWCKECKRQYSKNRTAGKK
jgi:hypothetical protein